MQRFLDLVVVAIVVVAVGGSAAVVVSYPGFVMLVVSGLEEGLGKVADFLIATPQNDIFYDLPSKSKYVVIFMFKNGYNYFII